jgi:DNA polymerase III subunit alpha
MHNTNYHRTLVMFLVFDTETSGLPTFCRRYPYGISGNDTCRLVQISWILMSSDLEVLEKKTYLVKPKDFLISDGSYRIHGISNEYARDHGVTIEVVLTDLERAMEGVHTLVAHNITFDVNVLKSECYRVQFTRLSRMVMTANRFCTMSKGKVLLSLTKNPKLSELYKMLYDEEMQNAHDAEFDTHYCYMCFLQLVHIPAMNPVKVSSTKRKLAPK